jgi:methyl-accepting chemotaxis protein
LVVRSTVGPLVSMTEVMRRLADGDKTVQVPSLGRKDEIGNMAQAVAVFKDNAVEKVRLEAEQAEQERLTKEREHQAEEEKRAQEQHAQEQRQRELMELGERFQANVKSISEMATTAAQDMQTTAQSMADTTEETGHKSAAVAAASEQATANVQTVASVTEELSGSIQEIGRQVDHSSKIAQQAVQAVDATTGTVQGLNEAALRIGQIVKLINDIAEQTNLLALNATIEAARAGDAGKGFAVVASEVKSLATQTAKATEEISTQITNMQGVTTDTVAAIGVIGRVIGEIKEVSTAIASAVEEQNAATQEIARNVQEAAAGTQDVTVNIDLVRGSVTETGTAAGQVLEAAGELSRQSETLRSEVGGFLDGLRAA